MQDTVIKRLAYPFFIYEENGRKGIIYIYSNIIINAEYDQISFISQNTSSDKKIKGHFTVCRKNTCREAALNRKILTENIQGKVIRKASDNCFAAGKPQFYMNIVDSSGREITERTFENLHTFGENYFIFASYGENGGIGIVSCSGRVIMEALNGIHDIEQISSNELILIRKADKYGIVYKNKIILEPEYENIHFYRGHVLIKYQKDGESYYYIAPFKDFENNQDSLDKYPSYSAVSLKDIGDDCFSAGGRRENQAVYCTNSDSIPASREF